MTAPTSSKLKLLLVDDDPAIMTNLAPFLQRAGFTVSTAPDGVIVLNQVNGFRPDLIILDVLMPRLDGRELLRRLRRSGGRPRANQFSGRTVSDSDCGTNRPGHSSASRPCLG